MQRLITVSLFLTLSMITCAGTVRSQELLRWKLKPGEKLGYRVEQEMKMFSISGGTDTEMKMTSTMDIVWDVKAVDADGNASLGQTISRVQLTMEREPFGELKYDSNSEEILTNPILQRMATMYDSLVGNEWTLTMSPTGQTSEVKLPEKLLATLRSNPQLAGMVGGGEKMLETLANQSGVVLPDEPVSEGTSWQHVNTMDMPFGRMIMNLAMTYNGTEARAGRQYAKIVIKPEMKIEPKADAAITVEVDHSEANGILYFDAAAGRIARTSTNTDLEMTINSNIKQKIVQSMTMKSVPLSTDG